MMMPALPIANLVVRQAGFAFGTLNTFFDPMLGFGHSGKVSQLCFGTCIGQVVIRLDHMLVIPVSVTNGTVAPKCFSVKYLRRQAAMIDDGNYGLADAIGRRGR